MKALHRAHFQMRALEAQKWPVFLKTVVHRTIVFFGKREIVSDNYFLQTLFLQDCY